MKKKTKGLWIAWLLVLTSIYNTLSNHYDLYQQHL